MKRTVFVLLLAWITTQLGCAMCCTPWDCAYAAFGGKWQRGDLNHGRVGSVFSPAESHLAQPLVAPLHDGPIIEHGY